MVSEHQLYIDLGIASAKSQEVDTTRGNAIGFKQLCRQREACRRLIRGDKIVFKRQSEMVAGDHVASKVPHWACSKKL